MRKECVYNRTVSIGFTIIFQVVFIFAFLTIFFFNYVVNIEKSEFHTQLNIIIDNILSKDVIQSIIPHGVPGTITPQQEAILISGIIDTVIEKGIMDGTSASAKVLDTNNKIQRKANIALAIVSGSMIIITVGILLIGYCIPIFIEIREALWVVLFVAITEFFFLMVIARNYISADPNYVRRSIGNSVENWISHHIHR